MPGKTLILENTGLPGDSFNEAPAKCRGKPTDADAVIVPFNSFNEAPAKCRGKRLFASLATAFPLRASMRPQRNAGENLPNPPQISFPRNLLQ